MIILRSLLPFTLLFAAVVPAAAAEEEAPVRAGTFEARLDGKRVHLPLLENDVSVEVSGDIATVTVRQVFENPSDVPLNATYLFPLNKEAAVYGMNMEVGDEIITAVIQQKEEAEATFEAAKEEGKAAALLTEHRPNMFTQKVANLMPGMPITVTLRYVHGVPRVDGAYELVVPLVVGLVVGPRYTPSSDRAPRVASAETLLIPAQTDGLPTLARVREEPEGAGGGWPLGPPPAYPPAYPSVFGLTVPERVSQDRVSIDVSLNAAQPLEIVESETHALDVTGTGPYRFVTLADGRTIDNQDFVLRYQLAGEEVTAGALTHQDERGRFVSLLIEPPARVAADDITPREIVFVLDTSGSMSGDPMAASKAFMMAALDTLRPTDQFRLIQFSNSPAELSQGPVAATARQVRQAKRYVSRLRGSGGTEVLPALRQAFRVPQREDTLRIVVFLSDGYVGNEPQILRFLGREIRDARFYAFGVGTAPNRYLLTEMAHRGRGFARFVDPTEPFHETAQALAQRIEAPVLTDLTLDWGGASVTDVTPAVLPDLFAGDSLRVMGVINTDDPVALTVRGKNAGREAALPVAIDRTADANSAPGLPLMWARSQVTDLTRDLSLGMAQRRNGFDDEQLIEEITALGLDFSLVTPYTSFVAVSEQVVNERPLETAEADVPLPMVKGVGPLAYPQTAQFTGTAAPEPPLLLMGLLFGLYAGVAGLWRKLRARGLGS